MAIYDELGHTHHPLGERLMTAQVQNMQSLWDRCNAPAGDARRHGLPDFCDHWRRLATARSVDNGLTWTDYQVHFDFGKVGITSRSRTVR